MTRFASIMGVAAVATLVLLSGCETPMKTDYAKDLAGIWKVTLPREVVPDPAVPTVTVPVMTAVEATVTRTGTNEGTVKLTVTDTPPLPHGPVSVMGSIKVTATDIEVSNVVVEPMALLDANPTVAAGLAQGLTLTYELSDDGSELDVTNAALFTVLLGANNTTIKLSKDTSGNSGG